MSSISKAPSPKNNMASDEESGWTSYFEDFFNNQNNNIDGGGGGDHNNNGSFMYSNFSGVDCSSSLVSDAASMAEAKFSDKNVQAGEEYYLSISKKSNRSSFKKRKKIKTTLVDDALEDTASSPVNSPKVLYEKHLHRANQKEQIDSFQEKGNTSSGQQDERKELGFDGRDSDCTELKKRGLCLVPLSMVLKYLG